VDGIETTPVGLPSESADEQFSKMCVLSSQFGSVGDSGFTVDLFSVYQEMTIAPSLCGLLRLMEENESNASPRSVCNDAALPRLSIRTTESEFCSSVLKMIDAVATIASQPDTRPGT
jgi:hypothetical protein